MRRIVQSLLRTAGLELRRARRVDLPRIANCRCDGVAFPFWITNEHAADWWLDKDVRFDAEMAFLKEVTSPGAVVLEVGAHHGIHTVQLARWAGPTGQIHAFELNGDNALTLSANVGLNRLNQVTVVNAAAGDRAGSISALGERVVSSGPAIPSVTLDGYCRGQNITRVDVLKIDVEGFEQQVLTGASSILAQRPAIDLELHLDDLERYQASAVSVLDQLPRHRYQASFMARPNWFTANAFDGPDSLPSLGVVNLFLKPLA